MIASSRGTTQGTIGSVNPLIAKHIAASVWLTMIHASTTTHTVHRKVILRSGCPVSVSIPDPTAAAAILNMYAWMTHAATTSKVRAGESEMLSFCSPFRLRRPGV